MSCPVDEHGFHLGKKIVFVRCNNGSGNIASDYNIRIELIVHYIGRKVIIDTSVKKQLSVHADGFQVEWIRDGSTYCFAEITISEGDRFFFFYICGNAAERNEQGIELLLAAAQAGAMFSIREKSMGAGETRLVGRLVSRVVSSDSFSEIQEAFGSFFLK